MQNSKIYQQEFLNIDEKTLDKKLEKSYLELKKQLENQEYPQIQAIFDEKSIQNIKNCAKKLEKFKKILVIGVGGSSLGGKTFKSLSDAENIDFLESIDPVTINKKINKINTKEYFFLVISKSGETIETISQTLLILQYLDDLGIKDISDRFLFITQDHENSLAKIAKSISAEIYLHPSDVGGRFSCFTVVGLLPAILAGIDIDKIIEGAKSTVGNFLGNNENEIVKAIQIQNNLFDRGFTGNVVMPYIDAMKNYTDWYRQLWAESLGKKGFGSTPINSMGTVDQHSQLQLYLEGPKDKFFTFFIADNHRKDLSVKDLADVKTLFGGKKLSEIVAIESQTTIQTLTDKNLPIRIFKIEEFNETSLGSLMMHMFLEVILFAKLRNIDPFDQPGVEIRKNMAKELLDK